MAWDQFFLLGIFSPYCLTLVTIMIKTPTAIVAGMQIPVSHCSYSLEIRMSYQPNIPFYFQSSTVFLSQGMM